MNPKSLRLGVLLGVGLCILLNAISLVQVQFVCAGCPVTFGFPFPIAAANGLAGGFQILWLGLAADLLLSIGVGMIAIMMIESRMRKKKRMRGK
jgi:hypothetical protein